MLPVPGNDVSAPDIFAKSSENICDIHRFLFSVPQDLLRFLPQLSVPVERNTIISVVIPSQRIYHLFLKIHISIRNIRIRVQLRISIHRIDIQYSFQPSVKGMDAYLALSCIQRQIS